jgi:hypothetical protein
MASEQLRVCNECVRAVALIGPRDGLGLDTSYNAISRHPESGASCALCRRGPGEHDAGDFVRLVVEQRARLSPSAGTGAPPGVD